ncbi:hypothetical protein [Cohaesibacter haloalkalitolerans]|uniref:hypothetical protein n=1 Tax=Cohaesibacter haloalkalitolerans TaxID=1162980 RepID=UPI000E65A327|nr:hypothetical protein [Cohaesibacter haloalkalitolerans]
MAFSGEYRLSADYRAIKKKLKDPVYIQHSLQNCIETEQLSQDTVLAKIVSSTLDGQIVHYIFRFIDQDPDLPYLEVDWQGTDPHALMPKGHHRIWFRKEGRTTIMKIESELHTTLNGKLVFNDPEKTNAIMSDYFSRFVDEFNHPKERTMKNDKPELDEVLNEAKNAVEELEVEAESAAAKGFLGGAQMWAWIALAILVILLLVLY